MDAYILVGVAFFTSTLTAIIGMGGGIMLISAMPGLLPAAAIISGSARRRRRPGTPR